MADKPTYEELEQRIKELEGQRSGHLELDLAAIFQGFEGSFPVGITDHKGVLLYVNNSLMEMWGYSCPEDIIGRQLTEFWEGPGIYRTMEDLATKGWSMGEDIGKRKDGSLFPVEYKAIMCKNIDSKPLYMLGQFFDISEEKRAREALRESQENYRLHFENVSDVIYSIDPDFRVISVSPSVEGILGYKPLELVGRPFQDLNVLAPEYLEQAFSNTTRMLAGEPIGLSVYEFISKDGTRKVGEVSGAPLVRDGKVVAMISVARDITRRRQAEKETEKYREHLEELVNVRTSEFKAANRQLQEEINERKQMEIELKNSEERLQIIFDYAPDAYYLNDLKGNFVDGNRAAERLVGYKKEKLVGKNFLKLKLLPPMQIPKAARILTLNVLGKRTGPDEFTLNRKDGGQVIAEIRTHPVKIQGKSFVLGIARDITRRKLVEKELRQTKNEAEAANRTKSEFLANMSHELRTPLNHIIGFTELVVDKHLGDLNETQEEYLGDVLYSSKHLLSLINDILDLSKVEAGKLELELSDVNLKRLLENSLVMIREKAMKHGIQLPTDMKGIPETITADERKLKQIMYNLLSNAVKFTPDGGEIRLSANLADGSLLLADGCKGKDSDKKLRAKSQELPASRKFARISVSDTGIGIRKEDLDRIFNPFEQVENTASRKFHGTGLGLSLTKTLVELHSGKIWVESEGEGRGSTFRIVIPI